MAKKEKKTFAIGPWNAPKRFLKDFLQVTDLSVKNAVVTGRIFYFFETLGSSDVRFNGTMIVQPLFQKGPWRIQFPPWKGHPRSYSVTFFEDQNYEEVKTANRAIIIGAIKKGELYIKHSDPLIKFNYEGIKNQN